MAQRRLINKSLGSSKKFLRLQSFAGDLTEFAQILFALIIPNTDDFGRFSGDAETAKYGVFPISTRSLEDFEKALQCLCQAGLITLYDVEGERYLEVVNFEREQSGLHKRTKSHYPGPGGKEPPKDPPDPRREPLMGFASEQWEAARGCKLTSATTTKDWVQFAAMLKRTKNDPVMTAALLKRSLATFLQSPDEFHQKQGFGYWCSNVTKFINPGMVLMPKRNADTVGESKIEPREYSCRRCQDTGRVIPILGMDGVCIVPWSEFAEDEGREIFRCSCEAGKAYQNLDTITEGRLVCA